jgi:hypothetical protein
VARATSSREVPRIVGMPSESRVIVTAADRPESRTAPSSVGRLARSSRRSHTPPTTASRRARAATNARARRSRLPTVRAGSMKPPSGADADDFAMGGLISGSTFRIGSLADQSDQRNIVHSGIGAWFLVLGSWSLVLGPWSLVRTTHLPFGPVRCSRHLRIAFIAA